MIDELLRAVRRVAATTGPADAWVRPYHADPGTMAGTQFLVMLKPELATRAAADDGGDVLAVVLDRLRAGGVDIGAVRVLSTAYLAAHRVMQWHYAMLYQVSTRGPEAVPEAVRQRLAERYPRMATAPHRVLGGHQFLEKFPDFTPYALDALTRNLTVSKLGAGVYAIEALLDGEPWLLLNPFHPCQLEHFTRPGRSMVLMECRTERPLKEIRHTVVGGIDPAAAEDGSVRGLLFRRREELGLWNVCTRLNGIHASPSPVEAMFTVQRYFSPAHAPMPLEDTVLGMRLAAAGADLSTVQALDRNPEMTLAGCRGPLFEITEDVSGEATVRMLTEFLAPSADAVRGSGAQA